MNRRFQEHVEAMKEAERRVRDAVMLWAQAHAPDAKVKDLGRLMSDVVSAVETGMTRSHGIGYEQGKEDMSRAAA